MTRCDSIFIGRTWHKMYTQLYVNVDNLLRECRSDAQIGTQVTQKRRLQLSLGAEPLEYVEIDIYLNHYLGPRLEMNMSLSKRIVSQN